MKKFKFVALSGLVVSTLAFAATTRVTDLQVTGLTASQAVVTDSNKKLSSSSTTSTQLNYISNSSGTTGTNSTNIVFSTSPTIATPTLTTPTITAPTISSGNTTFSALTASTVTYLDASKILTSSATTPTQLGYLSSSSGTTGTNSTNLVFSGSPVLTGTPTINSNAPIIKAVAANDGVYLQFNNSAGTGRGYFGYGGSSSSTMTIENTESGLMNFATNGTTRMQIPAATGVVNLNGSTTQNICIGRENGTTPRVAHANVTGSLTTPTFSKQSGDFNTSITRNGAGDYTLAFTGSPFSDTPSCTVSSTSGSAVSCGVYTISTTGFSTFCFTSTTGIGSDTGSSITCMGPK